MDKAVWTKTYFDNGERFRENGSGPGFSLHIFFYNANMGLHLLASPDLLMEHLSKYIVIANIFLQSESIKGIVSQDE
jgi:hypothetical protein